MAETIILQLLQQSASFPWKSGRGRENPTPALYLELPCKVKSALLSSYTRLSLTRLPETSLYCTSKLWDLPLIVTKIKSAHIKDCPSGSPGHMSTMHCMWLLSLLALLFLCDPCSVHSVDAVPSTTMQVAAPRQRGWYVVSTLRMLCHPQPYRWKFLGGEAGRWSGQTRA